MRQYSLTSYFMLLSSLLVFLGTGYCASATLLLSDKALRAYPKVGIQMTYSRAYPGIKMRYQSILMQSLLKDLSVKPTDIIELTALDSFSVFVPAHLFLKTGPKDSIAYLAIEPDVKWPMLKNGTRTTAGPYQVIWTHPEKSHISDEYWAWSVKQISIYPHMPKNAVISKPKVLKKNIQQGYKIYISHCAACHTIFHIGKAVIGPDFSGNNFPTERYPSREMLKAFIRNPSKFRPGRMSGSSKEGLNEQELDALIDYFEYTAASTGHFKAA